MVGSLPPVLPQKKDLRAVADAEVMKKIWKKILRPLLRVMRFTDFELGHDPLEYLAFDWQLDQEIQNLCREVQAESYRATPPEVVRSAKGTGLTRPLAFLSPRDAVLYRTIIALGENALLQASKPWVRFGRADVHEGDTGDTTAESGWFRNWLRRQGQLWAITGTHDWLVETDIASFFPHVQISAVLDHVLANSDLGEDAARLLGYILREFAPMDEYRISPVGGLPQENKNCSRILAHTYLKPVDDEFDAEGENDEYSRWVDDVVIGASSREDGLRKVLRVQRAFERLGFHPNTAKTRIIPAAYFNEDYMKVENDYLGDIDEKLKASESIDLVQFRRRLKRHLRRQSPRPKAWGRVLRRYYTASRHLRDTTLLKLAIQHMEDHPDSARHIFEYLVTFPLTPSRFRQLADLLERLGGVYQDIDILAHEYICAAPNSDKLPIRQAIATWALATLQRVSDHNPRLAASACMTIGKFGLNSHLDLLEREFEKIKRLDTVARQQAVVVLVGCGRLSESDLSDITPLSKNESEQHVRFLRSLIRGDERAVGLALGLVQPVERRNPPRYVIRPRALFLAPILRNSAPQKLELAAKSWRRRLFDNADEHRDLAAERWLGI